MSFWSGQTITKRAQGEGLIAPFDSHCVECSSYELHVGYEAFVTRDKLDQEIELTQGRTPGHLVAHGEESICIPSGQFGFLITKEKVKIPNDTIGFISLKTRKKFRGLVNVSGFHVDPGWSGRLIFAVFNAGPLSIVIKPDEPLFLLFFANLDYEAEDKYSYKGKSNFSKIPPELMETMIAPVPTVYKLNDAVSGLRETVKSADSRSIIAMALAGTALTMTLAIMAFVVNKLW